MKANVEKFAHFAKFGDKILIGARRLATINDWTWNNQILFEDTLTNQSTVGDYRINAAVIVVDKQKTFVARHPVDELPYICEYNVGSKWCKETSVRITQDASCFVAYTDQPLTWHNARNKCLFNGGDLPVLYNTANIAVSHLTSSQPMTPFWVGLRSSWWTWPNGEEMLFSYWAPGQPANAAAFCVVLSTSYLWETFDCDGRLSLFICQKEAQVVCTWCITLLVLCVLLTVILFYRRHSVRRRLSVLFGSIQRRLHQRLNTR
jgi:hypothetical protein